MEDCLSVTVNEVRSLHLIYAQGRYSPFRRRCMLFYKAVEERKFN